MKLEPKTVKLERYNNDTLESIIRMEVFYKNADDLSRLLLSKKISEINPIELYNVIKKIFDIKLDKNDYLKILSIKNDKHYNKIIRIKTTMFDLNGNNISYNCVISRNIKIDDNHRLDKNKLRELTNSKDILLLKEYKLSDISYLGRIEKEEPFLLQNFNIENSSIDEDSELFIYISEYIKKETLKNISIIYELTTYYLIKYYEMIYDQIKEEIRKGNPFYSTTGIVRIDIYDAIIDRVEFLQRFKDYITDDTNDSFMELLKEANYNLPVSISTNNSNKK